MQPISEDLLAILVCPADRTRVRVASDDELATANQRQARGELKKWDGSPVDTPLRAMLIREDGKIGYRINDGIPVMLVEEAVVLDDAAGPMPEFS